MIVPGDPKKFPVKSLTTKLLLPVQRISPHPPNHPRSAGLFYIAKIKLLASQDLHYTFLRL